MAESRFKNQKTFGGDVIHPHCDVLWVWVQPHGYFDWILVCMGVRKGAWWGGGGVGGDDQSLVRIEVCRLLKFTAIISKIINKW